jgi:hypothetical protein
VRTVFPDFPRLPVKTDQEIALEGVRGFMRAVNEVCVRRRCLPGEIVAEDLLGSGVNLIATAAMTECGAGVEGNAGGEVYGIEDVGVSCAGRTAGDGEEDV